MNRIITPISCVLLIFILASCSSHLKRLRRTDSRVSMLQTAKKQIVKPQNLDSLSGYGSNVTTVMTDSVKQFITDVDYDEDGNAMSLINIDEIVVTSTLKTIPERFGYVVIDFVVNVPPALMDTKWSLVLTPVLHRSDTTFRLEKVVITGDMVRKYQKRVQKHYNESYANYTKFNMRRKAEMERYNAIGDRRNEIMSKRVETMRVTLQRRVDDLPQQNLYIARHNSYKNSSLHNLSENLLAQTNSGGVWVNNFNDVRDQRRAFYQRKEADRQARQIRNFDSHDYRYMHVDRKAHFDTALVAQRTPNFFEEPLSRVDTANGKQPFLFDRRFKTYKYEDNVRVDSIYEEGSGKSFQYLYSQNVKTEGELNRFSLTMEGYAKDMRNRTMLPLNVNDTMKYTVTSMLSMIDTADRYVYNIVSKYATVHDRNWISFPLGKSTVIDTLGDNRAELEKVRKLLHSLIYQYEFHVDTITLTAASSPEGAEARNERLSRDRAVALKDYLTKLFDVQIDTLFTVKWVAEDWTTLYSLVQRDTVIRNKPDILKLMRSTPNADNREHMIRRQYPADYKYMLKELYPKLRAVNFKYDLRRVGMIQDTVYTTSVDTTYRRGVLHLKNREYAKALAVLDSYKDINTVITLMSLGYDKAALEIIVDTPETPEREYLTAVLLSRVGRYDEALAKFRRACKAKEALKYRGNLDPEIQGLMKRFNIDINDMVFD